MFGGNNYKFASISSTNTVNIIIRIVSWLFPFFNCLLVHINFYHHIKIYTHVPCIIWKDFLRCIYNLLLLLYHIKMASIFERLVKEYEISVGSNTNYYLVLKKSVVRLLLCSFNAGRCDCFQHLVDIISPPYPLDWST